MEMKKVICLFLALCCIASLTNAQGHLKFGIGSGYAASQFKMPGSTETYAIPVTLHLLYGNAFKFGIEGTTNLIKPFQYKAYQTATDTQPLYTVEITQTDVMAVAMLEFGTDRTVLPYIRAAGGGSFGSYSQKEGSSADVKRKFDNSFGWNGGIGFNIYFSPDSRSGCIFLEYIYQSVPKKLEDNSLSFKAVTSQVRAGLRF